MQPSAPVLAQPTSQGGKQVRGFDLLEELGRGGMGVVYKAKQRGLDRVVALKMVLHGSHATAEDLQRFRAEAEAIARLRHGNIVEVYAFGESEDGLPYFALEFCGGGTLAQRCAPGALLIREAVELLALLARAVQAAHAAGIVHRDLKPANVLLTADGVPKIADFGIAKGLGGPEGRTQTGAILGTPSYMAPEQAAGRTNEIGPPADIYALGAILFHMLTGRPPFVVTGVELMRVLHQVQFDEPTSPRRLRKDIPPDLEAIVLQCLEKPATARYPSAGELAADLDRWLCGDLVQAHGNSIFYRVRKRIVRKRKWIALGTLLALMVVLWVLLVDRGYSLPWWRKRSTLD